MQPPRNQIIVGDAREVLLRLPDSSVDCVITSPPYFGLRDYQLPNQIGLEPSVHGWVDNLLNIFDQVARILKGSGSMWLNLGDSYSRKPDHGAPPKGLVLGPERLLIELTKRGWLVRNKVVWAKTNFMPSSIQDRLTCSWEPVYLLVREQHYFFDLDAIRLPHASQRTPTRQLKNPERPAWAGPLVGDNSGLARLKAAGLPGHPLGKNPSDVWRLPISSFRSAHHATFSEALAERPLLATCPERACRACGQPWTRERVHRKIGSVAVIGKLQRACECKSEWQPGLVLDPFIGSGTTAVVAQALGRDWLGIEMNANFASIASQRISSSRFGRNRAA
ncbi:MAG: DNA-methyltransferase [Actinomycetota bacterium]